MRYTIEYVWIKEDTNNHNLHLQKSDINIIRKNFQSKVRTLESTTKLKLVNIPEWSYYYPSIRFSEQSEKDSTVNIDIILKPIKLYSHYKDGFDYLVLCQTFNSNNTPHQLNTRSNTLYIFNNLFTLFLR